jgi:hypothetical protein
MQKPAKPEAISEYGLRGSKILTFIKFLSPQTFINEIQKAQ